MRGSYGRGLALVAALLWLGCDAPPEPAADAAIEPAPEELASVVPELVDAVQAKQPAFIMDHVSESFAEAGGLDYFDVRALVDTFAFRDEDVGARLESVAITPAENGTQRVAARIAFALGTHLADGNPLPPGAVVYDVDLVFAQRDGRWLAQGGTYKRE